MFYSTERFDLKDAFRTFCWLLSFRKKVYKDSFLFKKVGLHAEMELQCFFSHTVKNGS